MREILFRGKQIDTGAWVEGAFCMKDCDDPFGELVDRPSMTTEKRLIDANDCYETADKCYTQFYHHVADLATLRDLLNDCPTVDAVEVVHGRWEPRKDVPGFVRCSVCHDCNIYDDWADGKKWNYCPNCGAKMDGDGNDV